MMNRLGKLLTGGVALLTVGAVATVWATSSTAADARFVTATAATGDVTQTYLATGSISRDNNVTATFTVDGTVRKVHVAIGDEVQAGDLLARLNTAELKLALLNAETDLAQAKASLYEARHPASSSSGSSSGSGSSGGLPSGGGSTPGGSTGGISAADAATLYEAIAAVNAASANWSSADADNPTTCDLAYAALLAAQDDSGETGDTGTAAGGSGGSGSGDSGSGDSGSGDSGSGDSGSGDSGSGDSGAGDPASGDSGSGDSGSGDSGSGDSGSADSGSGDADDSDAAQFSLTVDEITVEDIQACGEARTALLLANARLADYYNQLVTTGTIGDKDGDGVPDQPANGGSGSGSSSSSSSSSSKKKSSSSSSSTSTSARAIASAKADVLEAQQAVDAAELDVANAELVAPIDGTVGAMTLAKGDSASSASVTIVGEGTATVSIEVPLTTRKLLSQGMAAEVTPAGSSEVLEGKVSTISTLETDGISGDSPTYTTTVVVSDPDQRLKAGAKASVAIVTGTATGVITVPASAVTPTAAGKGTVQVVDTEASDTASTVEVTTGTVGGGRVEIASGVEVGQLVVLSDRTIDISTLTSSSSSSNRFGGGGMMR
jgi:HlyD family secretion protein